MSHSELIRYVPWILVLEDVFLWLQLKPGTASVPLISAIKLSFPY